MSTRRDAAPLDGRFRLLSEYGVHVDPAAVEVDGVDEVLPVAKTTCRVLHPLDLRVERFAARIGDAVAPIDNDVLLATFQHARNALDRFQPAALRPAPPPAEMLPRRTSGRS